MLVVGLTGQLATGKSTVASMFARLGAKIISSDSIVHQALRRNGPCYTLLVRTFGDEIKARAGIDRKKLAALVFADTKKLKRLEGIIHPVVRTAIRQKLAEYKKRAPAAIIIIEVPLLFEVGFDRCTDTTIVVVASQSQQIERAQRRLKLTRTQVRQRIQAQMPLRDKIRRADIIIDNTTTQQQTQKQVSAIWQKLIQRRRK